MEHSCRENGRQKATADSVKLKMNGINIKRKTIKRRWKEYLEGHTDMTGPNSYSQEERNMATARQICSNNVKTTRFKKVVGSNVGQDRQS